MNLLKEYSKFVNNFEGDCLPVLIPERIWPLVSIFESGTIDGIKLADSYSSKTEFFFKGCSKYTTKLIWFGKEESMLSNLGTKCWLVKITFGDVCWIPYLKTIKRHCYLSQRLKYRFYL